MKLCLTAKKDKACGGVEERELLESSEGCGFKCQCQDGVYACSKSCPNELSKPLPSAECRNFLLVDVAGRCCKEWLCVNSSKHSNNTAFENVLDDKNLCVDVY